MGRGKQKEAQKPKAAEGVKVIKTESDQLTTNTNSFATTVQQPMHEEGTHTDPVLATLESATLYGNPVNLQNADIPDAPELPAQQQKANGFGSKVKKLADKITKPFRSHKTQEIGQHSELQEAEEHERLVQQQEEEEKRQKEQKKTEGKKQEKKPGAKSFRNEVDDTVAEIDRQLYGKNAGKIADGISTWTYYRGKELEWDGSPDPTYAGHVKKLMDSFHDVIYHEDEELTVPALESLEAYSDDSTLINDLLRDGKQDDDDAETVYKNTKGLVEFLNKTEAPEDMFTVRHMDLSGLSRFVGIPFQTEKGKKLDVDTAFAQLEDKVNYQDLVGMDKGVVSTTTIPQGTSKFNRHQVEMRIMIPKGTHGCFLKECSEFQEEDEFLIQAGTSFRVLKIEKQDTGHGGPDGNPKIVVYVKAMPNKFDMSKFPPFEG